MAASLGATYHPPVTLPQSDHFVIIGSDGLSYRLAEQLSTRYVVEVVVLMTAQQQLSAKDFSELARTHVIVADRIDERSLRQTNLATAAGCALTIQDDVGNIHVALRARDIAVSVRLVVRMYNTVLGKSIEALLGNCKVIADSEIAAPELVATALGKVSATSLEISGRTFVVTRREDVLPQDIVCGLADTTTPDEPRILPAEGEPADLVLAEPPKSMLETTVGLRFDKPERPSWLRVAGAVVSAVVTRKSRAAVAVVLGIIVLAGTALGLTVGLGLWEGFYLAAVTALGGPQTTPGYDPGEQAWQLVLGAAGLAFIPLITAIIVEGVVRARLAVAEARIRMPHSDHIVVVGLGGVGSRVLRLLHEQGRKVVAVSADEDARGVTAARELEIPLLIGDPSREITLRMAGVERCRALMAISNNDVSNLETALHGRNLQQGLHVVLRVFDGELADLIRRTFNLPLSRSVSYLAAPAFAEALMDREVIGTIPVERHVLLVAQVYVTPGAPLEGTTVAAVDNPGSVRVIAVTPFGEPRPLWHPAMGRRVDARDTLAVVATRDGLSQLIRASSLPD